MLEVGKNSILKLSKKFLLHKIDEEVFWLFDLEDGDVYELNSSSYFILSCFDGKTPLILIQDRVISKYGDTKSTDVINDLKEFVKKMIDENIFEPI